MDNALESVKLPEYNELISKVITWAYGSLHTHDEIASIMQLEKNTSKYHSMVSRANNKLIEKSKMLINVKGQGYKVVNPDEYVDVSHREAKRATKKFRKAYKINDNAPIEQMTEEGRKKYRSYNERLGILRAITEGVYKEITTLARQPLNFNTGRN